MNKLGNVTKKLLILCGFLCIISVLFVVVNFILQKTAVENSDNGWDAIGLVIIFIFYSLPFSVLNLGLAVLSFITAKRLKKSLKNDEKFNLGYAIAFLILTAISGVGLGLQSFMAVYFEPISITIGVMQFAIGIITIVYAVKNKKSLEKKAEENASLETLQDK